MADDRDHQALAVHVGADQLDRKSTRLNSSHANISYAVFCLKKKKIILSFSLVYFSFLHLTSTPLPILPPSSLVISISTPLPSISFLTRASIYSFPSTLSLTP